MSERKVLSKYYPADFDPSLIARRRGPKHEGPKIQTVRLNAPFSLRCTTCGEFIYKGRKFNARKETPPGEKYLGIQIYRFYIRCTRCSAELVFSTDPQHGDYKSERGMIRTTEPWRKAAREAGELDETIDQRLDRLEQEEAEARGEEVLGKERDAMADLEKKTEETRREMAVADALDAIRMRNAERERAAAAGAADGVLESAAAAAEAAERRRKEQEEREDEEAARLAFARARAAASRANGDAPLVDAEVVVEEQGDAVSTSKQEPTAGAPLATAPSFKREIKKKQKKDYGAALGIKRKS